MDEAKRRVRGMAWGEDRTDLFHPMWRTLETMFASGMIPVVTCVSIVRHNEARKEE